MEFCGGQRYPSSGRLERPEFALYVLCMLETFGQLAVYKERRDVLEYQMNELRFYVYQVEARTEVCLFNLRACYVSTVGNKDE
jgi:hypothetical protein